MYVAVDVVPRLPAQVWLRQAGVLVNFVGNGMVAPDGLRGRYLGAMALFWQFGFLIGPSVGAAALGAAPLALPLLCTAACDAAAAGTFLVDRRLEPERRSSLAVAAT